MTVSSIRRKAVRDIIGTSSATREQIAIDQDDRADAHASSAPGQLATVAQRATAAVADESAQQDHTTGSFQPSSSSATSHAQQQRPESAAAAAAALVGRAARAEAARQEAASQLPSSVPFRIVDGTFVGDHSTATLLRAVGGGEAILRVTTLFYQRMFADPHLSQVSR